MKLNNRQLLYALSIAVLYLGGASIYTNNSNTIILFCLSMALAVCIYLYYDVKKESKKMHSKKCESCSFIDTAPIDTLASLEKVILKYYLAKGYKLFENQTENDREWTFQVYIRSTHKFKIIEVITYFKDSDESIVIFKNTSETLSQMYEIAFYFFNQGVK